LNLLKRKRSQKVSYQLLSDTWIDLQEYYFENTNANSFDSFRRNIKKIAIIKNEINICNACEMLIRCGQSDGFDILESIGIKAKEFDLIKSEIFRRETKIKLIESKMNKANTEESVKFYEMLARVEMNLPHEVNLDTMTLERWVNKLKAIREKQEAANRVYNERKGLNKKRR